jgi:hypothetical protein
MYHKNVILSLTAAKNTKFTGIIFFVVFWPYEILQSSKWLTFQRKDCLQLSALKVEAECFSERAVAQFEFSPLLNPNLLLRPVIGRGGCVC